MYASGVTKSLAPRLGDPTKCKEFRHLQRVSTCGVCAVSETDIIEKKESDMRVMLLAAAGSLAALAAGTGPALAQQFSAEGFSGGHHGDKRGGRRQRLLNLANYFVGADPRVRIAPG